MPDSPDDSGCDLGSGLDCQHRVEPADHTSGEESHVCAVEHNDVYVYGEVCVEYGEVCVEHGDLCVGDSDVRNGEGTTKHYEEYFSLGLLALRIVIDIDTGKKAFNIATYGKVPLASEFKIVSGSGSPENGLVLKFSLRSIDGEFGFYVKDQWLWLRHDVTNKGKRWVGDVKLIPLLQVFFVKTRTKL